MNSLSTYVSTLYPKDRLIQINNKIAQLSRILGNDEYFFVNKTDTNQNVTTSFEIEENVDENYPKGFVYFKEGETGEEKIDESKIAITTNGFKINKLINRNTAVLKQPVKKEIFKGNKDLKEFQNFVKDIIDNDIKSLELGENVGIDSIPLGQNKNLEMKGENIKLGNVKIVYKDCNYYISDTLIYNITLKTYKILDLESIKTYQCKKLYKFTSLVERAKCTDCTYYPVDKTVFLDKNYFAEFIELKAINDLHKMAKIAHDDFVAMYKAAEKAGHDINVTSAWRTYKDQEKAFKYWVDREMTLFGVDQKTAEERANRYSARPGFSEHQLGTTVDLNTETCEAFEGYCQANENLWAWLRGNAHKYGFVLSYPNGRELDTGYIAEPWHYRWLGKELALEYKKQEGKLTLNKWLKKMELWR